MKPGDPIMKLASIKSTPGFSRYTLNVLVGEDRENIAEAVNALKLDNPHPELYGDGHAAEKIIQCLTV